MVSFYEKKVAKQIIAGDFNADFQSRVIKFWVKDIKFQSVFKPEVCTICPTKNPLCYRDQHLDYQIDNVLYKGFEKATGKLIFNKSKQFISDHFGQIVDFKN